MKLLILAGVSMALGATLFLVLVKLLLVLLLAPVKLLGSLSAGLGHLLWVPLHLVATFLIVVVVVVGLLSLPVAVPLVIVGGLLLALLC